MSKKLIAAVLAGLVALAVIVTGVVWAFPVFKVTEYDIIGTERLPVETVQEATGVAPGDNLVRVDAQEAAAGVAQLPWVRTATVTRQWPSTLGVEITERRAVLFADEEDGTHLIDETGTPFIIDTPPEGAVEVTGEGRDDPEVLAAVTEVVESLPEHVRGQVARVDAPSDRDIELHLHDGRTVYWGSAQNNHDKALAMETVLTRQGQHWNISSPTMVTVR